LVEKNLDLRSDTVTLPTPEMRQAAFEAELGDDVYGDDPTVNQLEALSAEIFDKEAGLFVTSGTMGNAVSVLSHTQRGDEIILEQTSHIYVNEVGGLAVMGSLMARTIPGEKGYMNPDDIRKAIRAENIHYPRTSLLCIENTHNSAGGIALTPKQMKSNWDVAKENNLGVHLAKYADTIQICLSKGLSAPVGSIVVGSEDLIKRARKYRKMLGGGMRQAGIIAAPGIIALVKMVDRLEDDHRNAKLLAKGLQKLGIKVVNEVQTNMVYIDFGALGWKGVDWINACTKLGWKSRAGDNATGTRLVTHYGIEEEDIKSFLEGMGRLIP
jgi:threonine aldolase